MKANFGKFPGSRSKKERKIELRIDPWDSWNADHTIAMIAAPLLKQLSENKNGAPYVEDNDVPEELRSYNSEPGESEHDVDSNHFKRWDWVLGEIIWAMQEIADHKPTEETFFDHSEVDDSEGLMEQVQKIKIDREGLDAYHNRLKNGCRLMGIYFMNLWL